MKKWFDCIKEPSETGKKVLCQHQGDFYVAMRLGKHYFPMPFVDHYFSEYLCFPESWSPINFPEGFEGMTKVALNGDLSQAITLSELEVDYPDIFKEIFMMLYNSLAILERK